MSMRFTAAINKPGYNPYAQQLAGYLYNFYSWGDNRVGQLGNGSTTATSSPVQIGALNNWSAVSMFGGNTPGNAFGAAIKTDGTLWTWGYNLYGGLGQGNTTYLSSPKQVGALSNWAQAAGGQDWMVAVKSDGTLWSWGNGQYGQLGLGNRTYYSSPKQVGLLTNWRSVSCSVNSVAAIKTDGSLWMWGYGSGGELAQGNFLSLSSPTQVGALTNWKTISTGGSALGFFLAVKTDGTLWGWGQNQGGTLGLGNTSAYNSPKQVGALTTWLNVASAYKNSIATRTDGTLWTWGRNNYGQLGINASYSLSYSSPKQVGALTNWSKISAGSVNCAAIKTDGTLWTWGQAAYGQLGNNTSAGDKSSPIQIGAVSTWNVISVGTSAMLALG